MPIMPGFRIRSGNGAGAERHRKGHLADSTSSARLLDQHVLGNGVSGSMAVDPEGDRCQDLRHKEPARCRARVHPDTDEQLILTGYKLHRWRWACLVTAMVLTGGFLWLLLYWMPKLRLMLSHRIVSLAEADTLLMEEHYKKDFKRCYVKTIYTKPPHPDGLKYPIPLKAGGGFHQVDSYKYVNCKKETFIWDAVSQEFYPLTGLEVGVNAAMLHQQTGLAKEEQARRRLVFGVNDILVPFHSISYLLVKEVLNPFYVFQLFSVILWFSDEYYYYAAAIVIMSTGGVTLAVYQTRKNQLNLRSTVQSTDLVTVLRDDSEEQVSSDELVPGDVIVIPSTGCHLTFDGVLISGSAIVNEAMLTGEAVPETKTMLPRAKADLMFHPIEHQRHTLFRGTTVIQTRNYAGHPVLAVVIRTGFLTTKGKLVRSILYPAPVDFKFEKDSYKFIILLTLIASIGFIYTCIQLVLEGGMTAGDIFLEAADLITIVVPPALPAAMTIGSLYAQDRLKKRGIFCISPRTINVSGSVDCVCFDKTGTLTEDGLDLLGVVPVAQPEGNDAEVTFGNLHREPRQLDKSMFHMIECMASCHSVTLIDGKICGDPMDVIMFESTGWLLEEQTGSSSNKFDPIAPSLVRPPGTSMETCEGVDAADELRLGKEIGIIRQFQFSSSRQCMSVVVRDVTANHFTVYCKGSPEKIRQISMADSIPVNFEVVLDRYAEKGYRVIAAAKKDLPERFNYKKVHRMECDEAESGLVFLGLIVLENRIKKETRPVIEELKNARIRTIMVTGDHIQTALSVAKECGLIPAEDKVIMVTADECGNSSGKPQVFFSMNRSATNNNLQMANRSTGNDTYLVDLGDWRKVVPYHFAIVGTSFNVIREHFPDLLDRLCTRGAVFARMTPDQKEALIDELQALGYYVAMCGDGANDCGALKAAHAGISLSEAEASVASPFTSKEANISCVPRLVQEGRCALVTSFGIFKYMAAYSLTQFVSVMILYHFGTNLSDLQYLYIDLFLITLFAAFFGMTKPYEGELAKQPPTNSLISIVPVASLMLQMVSVITFQVLALKLIQSQTWFVPFDKQNPTFNQTTWSHYYDSIFDQSPSEYASLENYAIFLASAFQYIILAYVFSKSKPYRKRLFSNLGLLASMLAMTGFTLYSVVYPSIPLMKEFEILLPPPEHSGIIWVLIAYSVANVAVCIVVEDLLVEVLLQKLASRFMHSRPRYSRINEWMSKNGSSWPPMSSTVPATSSFCSDESNYERSPVETKIDFEVIDEEHAKQLFPFRKGPLQGGGGEAAATSTAVLSFGPLKMDATSAAVALNYYT